MKDNNVCKDLKGEVNHTLRKGFDELIRYQLTLVDKIDKRMGSKQLDVLLRGNDKERICLIYELLNCIHNEAEEVRDHLPWKSWKKYEGFSFKESLPEVKMEIVDLFHFVVELAMAADMTSEEMSQMFDAKHRENLNRQERNY